MNTSEQGEIYIYLFLNNKIVYLIYRCFFVYFSQGGTGVPCAPFLALVAPLYTVGLLCMWWSVVVVFCMMGIGVAEGGVAMVIPGALT